MSARPKVIQIGFHKCGTRTLYRFFRTNRIPSVHWEYGTVAESIQRNRAAGLPLLAGYESIIFFSDLMGPRKMPLFEGHFLFREFYRDYGDARFILNTRDPDRWIASRMRHPGLIARFRTDYGLATDSDVERLWRRQWGEHHKEVLGFFDDKRDHLLVLDIETQGGEEVAHFLRGIYALDPSHWGHSGKATAAGEMPRGRQNNAQSRPFAR